MIQLKGKVNLHHTYDGALLNDSTGKLLTEELSGEFVSESGESARYLAAVQICAVPGKKTWVQAFEVYTFDDGAMLYTGVNIFTNGDLQNPYQAEIRVLCGTGKFEGIEGQGRLVGSSDGQNAQHDIELSLV